MTTRASVNLHFDVEDIRHDHKPGKYATLDISAASGNVSAWLHFADTAMIDAAIAELVALKQEMDPPVITDSERTCPHSNNGEHCTRGGDHGVHRDSNGDEWRTDGDEREPSFIGGFPEDRRAASVTA